MKRLLLCILTVSIMFTAVNFVRFPATALVQTQNTPPAGYTKINTLTEFKAMSAGNKYYLANDIVMDAPYKFPKNITLNGNGHAILPPTGNSKDNPLLPAQMYHYNPGYATPADGHDIYEANCFFYFDTGTHTVTFENISFGTLEKPFCLKDDNSINDISGLALFPTNEYVSTLTCTNVDFHVYLDKQELSSGNMGGFLSVAFNTVTMTNCNMDAIILGQNSSSQAGCFFAQTQNSATMKLTMTGCTVLPGSRLQKKAQTGGFVGQVSGNATFTDCINYCDLVQTGGEHSGGIAANLYNRGRSITFSRCINYGTVQGRESVGGICGFIWGDDSYKSSTNIIPVNFNYCINAGKVCPSPKTVKETTNAEGDPVVTTTYYGERIGGILGSFDSYIKVTLDNCVNMGVIHGPEKETSASGYFHDSVSHFVGGIKHTGKCGTLVDKTDANGDVVTDDEGNPIKVRQCDHGVDQHSYYTNSRSDATWTWHYIYNSLPVTITNSLAYGKIVFNTDVAKKLNPSTGLNDEETSMYPGAIKYDCIVGNSVLLDEAGSSGNYKIDYNPGGGVIGVLTKETTRQGLTRLNNWLETNGFTDRCIIDYPNYTTTSTTIVETGTGEEYIVSTAPYVVTRPLISAVMLGKDHDHVRILAVINSLDYSKVGFNYSIRVYEDENDTTGTVEFNSTDHWTTAIYETVDLKTADQLGGKYIYELTFLNLPKDKTVRINIVPKLNVINTYYTDGKSEFVGQRYYLYFKNGEFIKCEIENS